MTPEASAIAETRAWVTRAVVGLNLCPFAKAPLVQDQIEFVLCETDDPRVLLDTLREQMQRLVQAAATEVETTLIVHPNVLNDFIDFNDFLEAADDLLEDLDLVGVLQIASFHPDYQFAGSNLVIGIEGQYSWLIRDDNNNGFVFPAGPAGGFVYYNNQRSLGSVTGRIGYTWGPALLYAKGGYAFAERRDDLFFGGAPFVGPFDRAHRDGYTVGAGLEYMFAPGWSLKGEYMYYNFDRNRFTTPAVLAPFGEWRNDVHTVKVGLNYRLNWGGSGSTNF